MSASVEEAQGDEVVGGAEPVGDAGEQPQLGVDAYLEPLSGVPCVAGVWAWWTCRRRVLRGSGCSVGALLTEALRDLLSKLVVLGLESADLVEGGFEPASQ